MQSKEATWRRRQRWERGDHVPKDTCSPWKPEEAGSVLSWVFSGLGPADTLIWGFWPLEQPLCCSGSLCCSSHGKQVQEQQAALLKTRLCSLVPYFFGKTILNGVDPSDGHCWCCSVAQSYPTLGHPMDCSPPGSSVHGILQARTREWLAMPFSGASS